MGLDYDRITVAHKLELQRPLPNPAWNKSSPLPGTDPNIYTRDLAIFPGNILPSGGTGQVVPISASEMVSLFLRLDNYPGSGVIDVRYVRGSDYQEIYHAQSFPQDHGGNPAYTSWYWWTQSVVGHFDWEINKAGTYIIMIHTSWGDAQISVEVTDSNYVKNTLDELKTAFAKMGVKIGALNDALVSALGKAQDALSKVEQEAVERKKDILGIWDKLEGWLVERIIGIIWKALTAEKKEGA